MVNIQRLNLKRSYANLRNPGDVKVQTFYGVLNTSAQITSLLYEKQIICFDLERLDVNSWYSLNNFIPKE